MDPSSFSPENQTGTSLRILPGGLHANFIRSALSALRVYEQTVTDLGMENKLGPLVLGEAEKGDNRAMEYQEVRLQ